MLTDNLRPVASDNKPAGRKKHNGTADTWSYEVDACSIREFDDLANRFSDLCYDQIAAYKALSAGGEQHRFVSFKNGRPAGGALVVVYRVHGTGLGMANIRFGPFWVGQGKTEPENYGIIAGQLVREFCQKQGLMLTVLPKPDRQTMDVEQAYLQKAGFTNRRPASSSGRYLVDLSLGEEEQLASLGQKWRYNLRKSMAENVQVRLAENSGDFADFESIHQSMIARKNLSLSDRPEILEQLQDKLEPNIRPRVYLAYHNGRPLAGLALAPAGDRVEYLYGATTEEAIAKRLGYRLQWHAISALKELGFRYYDLGGSSGVKGLEQFKKGLSGKRGSKLMLAPEYDCCSKKRARVIGDTLHLLRRVKNGSLRIFNQ